jgi:sugar O-acyltransferase (sialic acid O-acetyltransferase NeuD family)
MQDLIIFPYNGNGLEALNCLGKNFNFIGFADDNVEKQGKNSLGFMVYPRKAIHEFKNARVLAVPGSPTSFRERSEIISSLNLEQSRFATIIHPSSAVSPFAKVGVNTLIMAGVALTSNCIVGQSVCILPNSVVHHDSKVGDYTLIGSNVTIAGNTEIENNCYIGSGSSVINGIRVGAFSLIGMGSNVIRNVPPHAKVGGNPARII